jgi:hypothetical protein
MTHRHQFSKTSLNIGKSIQNISNPTPITYYTYNLSNQGPSAKVKIPHQKTSDEKLPPDDKKKKVITPLPLNLVDK